MRKLMSKTIDFQQPRICLVLIMLMLSINAAAEPHSQYAGQQNRTIKSLSPNDIQALEDGGGWGFAKTAELNSYPGPAHILELSAELKLTDKQTAAIQSLFNEMQGKAKNLGKQFIELEKKLDMAFSSKKINSQRLSSLIRKIEKVRAKLRFVHLSAHLETPAILTQEQITMYNSLRGYDKADCKNPPRGHNPEMWRKHHGCD